ncbi:MAG: hypothetical protein AAF483_00930 [Planctomycetota bacterium]
MDNFFRLLRPGMDCHDFRPGALAKRDLLDVGDCSLGQVLVYHSASRIDPFNNDCEYNFLGVRLFGNGSDSNYLADTDVQLHFACSSLHLLL